jgi:hypothetical protein
MLYKAVQLKAGKIGALSPITSTYGGITSNLALMLGTNIIIISYNKANLKCLI